MINKKIAYKDWVFAFINFILLLAFSISIVISHNARLDFNIFLFLFNLILSYIFLMIDRRIISLYKMNWYFIIIFLCIAPLCNYVSFYHPGGYDAVPYYLKANLCVSAWIFIFAVTYFLTKNKSKDKTNNTELSCLNYKSLYYFMFVVSIIAFVYSLVSIGLSEMFSKSTYQIEEGTWSIVITFFLKFTPVVTLCTLILDKKKFFFKNLIIFLLVVIIVILDNPIGNSRFNTAAVGLSIFGSLLYDKKLNGKLFDLFVFFAIVVIFPLMFDLRYNSIYTINGYDFSYSVDAAFNSVDFDAFSLLARSIEFVEDYGLQMGRQLINTIFFFVPKSILPIKGVNSGRLIVEAQNFGAYANVSCPIMGEAILDFGYFGMAIYAILIAWLFKKLDSFSLSKRYNFLSKSMYFLLYGFIIYIYRGALAPTFLRFMGASLPLMFFMIVKYFIQDYKKNKSR